MKIELKNTSNWVKFILVNFPKWEAGEPNRCASRNYPSIKALPPSLNLNQFSYLEPVRADNLIKAFVDLSLLRSIFLFTLKLSFYETK
jgi:hypothetical protein